MAKTKKIAREYKQEEIGKELKMFHYKKIQRRKTQKCRKWLKGIQKTNTKMTGRNLL